LNPLSLSPLTKYNTHKFHLAPSNASSIVKLYDIVLDCTDTPASRYLISDTCVLLGKPLISASALRTEGQLMLLNHPARPPADVNGGPCYRCIFPVPPPADSVLSCGEGGILGPVVGVMGVLQALEAIKMVSSGECRIAKYPETTQLVAKAPSMLLFSAYQDGQFRSIRMRRRNPKCAVCSAQATILLQSLDSGSLDYVQFCGITAPVQLLNEEERITAASYAEMLENKQSHIVLDVRDKVQFDLCHLDGSTNLPFSETACSGYETQEQVGSFVKKIQGLTSAHPPETPLYVVCRLGNDSQVVVKRLKQLGLDNEGQRWIGDVKGGLRAWTNEVDHDFPDY
jgi:adenylyltransferase/sulfurtransferase